MTATAPRFVAPPAMAHEHAPWVELMSSIAGESMRVTLPPLGTGMNGKCMFKVGKVAVTEHASADLARAPTSELPSSALV